METIDLTNLQNTETALEGIGSVAARAEKNLVILDNRLLTLRLSFGKLRAAAERAFAPVTAAVAPMLQSAVQALTDFCNSAGSVLAALFGTVYKKAVTTTKAAGGAVRRTVASFDQLERLNGGGGSGGSRTTVELQPINDPLTPQLQQIVDTIRAVMAKIQSLLAPLKTIDFTPAAEAFRRLGSAISGFGASVLTGLETAWHTLLVPLAKWGIETVAPASVDLLSAAFRALSALFEPLKTGFAQLQTALMPFVRFLGETVEMAFAGVQSQFGKLIRAFSENAPLISAAFSNLSQAFTAVWSAVQPVMTNLRSLWLQVLEGLGTAAANVSAGIIAAFEGMTRFLSGAATGNWRSAWEGLKTVLKGAVNGIIALINSLLSGLASGINAVIRTLNNLSVTVPSWVPVLGGKTFGFNIRPITAPQIPYLAKGAVLPANKPFLAMVGDQRHGTNIEAPLSTIQEAVAQVMKEQTGAIMAGFSASVEVQKEILSAVLGISIGDEVIAAAYDRCRSRQAVMKGAYYAL